MAYRILIEGKDFDKVHANGSIGQDPIISTKIKPIDESQANSEIEKGEIVLDPSTGAMHKALGKPHSKGGTPVSLKDNSFIFSNFKNLAINNKEKEVFEFKMGGRYKPINNTPSKILEKEIDIEHHNKMIDILQNEKSNTKESVNSAKLMMLKNLEKAGQVAFLQESKKNSQIPSFAQQSAPVYSSDTDQEINRSVQYMQSGGKKLSQKEIDEAEKNPLEDVNGWRYVWKDGRKMYYTKPGQSQRTPPSSGDQQKFDTWFSKQSKQFQDNYIKQSKTITQRPAQYGYKRTPINMVLPRSTKPFDSTSLSPKPLMPRPLGQMPTPQQVGDQPGDVKGLVDPTNQSSKLTPWQLINMGIPFARALNVKTQYPLRQHQESVIPKLENVNVQPQLDQNNQGYFNSANLMRSLNMDANAQQLYGNRIAANNQAIGNVQQANVATQNRQKELAAGSLNQDAAQNRAFDKQYYDQTQMAIKNTRDLKEAYVDQGINNANDTITKKLAFDSWLNTQQQYRGKATYIDQDGVQHYQGTPLYSPKAGFFGNSVVHNPVNIDWSTYQSSTGNKIDSPEELGKAYQQMVRLMPGLTPDAFIKSRTLMNYNTTSSNVPQSFKKGGKFRFKKSPF